MQPTSESSHATKGLIRLTMVCNERCPFCNVPMEDFPGKPIPPAQLDRLLDGFAAAGEQTVTLSGGEPTLLRGRLLGAIQGARARDIPFVELQTNAILIDGDYAAALCEAGLTSAFVSLLSQDPDHHDALAGLAGAWSRTLDGIDALLDAGVRVTLNVVVARQTQQLLAGFVDFVAERLPQVRSISVSAVQPHGRAASDPELLPDYAVLEPEVRRAKDRAAAHGIELLNPYCGLPVCVGWQDDLDHCVEAAESRTGRSGARGLVQEGNKAHGEPCRRCALRSRCGGAWHAYWSLRRGSGLGPPLRLAPPWESGGEGQEIIEAPEEPDEATWSTISEVGTPAVWLHTRHLDIADIPTLLASGATHLALEGPTRRVAATLEALTTAQRGVLPQDRIAVWIAVEVSDPEEVLPLVQRLASVGADSVAIRSNDPRVKALVTRAASLALSLELTCLPL